MALVSVEPDSEVLVVHADGHTDTAWNEEHLPKVDLQGIRWSLLPIDIDPVDGSFVIAEGAWTSGGYQAVLTRSTREAAPGAPVTVDIHNTNPRIGRTRW